MFSFSKSILFFTSIVFIANDNCVHNQETDGHSGHKDVPKRVDNPVLDYSVCHHRVCLGLGENDNCLEDQSCRLLLSGGYDKNEEGVVEFELTALPQGVTHTGKYYSMAFSTDTKMGNDLVTDCYVTSDGKVKLGSSNNIGTTNKQNEEFKESLNSIQTQITDGVVMCRWRANRHRTVNGQDWDMLNKYHILLAYGDIKSDVGVKTYHAKRQSSPEQINLTVAGLIHISEPPIILVRLHGALMVVAWMGTVSLGILFARYYKQTWVSTTICGVKIWFAFHRGLMVSSVLLMILAQFCIFYYLGTYKLGLHQGFGSVAFTLAILNPLGALLRPHPEASNRWVFNWGHWALGNTGHIAAIIAIFLSLDLPLADLPKVQVLWTVISYVIFYVIIHLILQFHTFFMQKRKTHDIALHDMSRSSDDPDMGTDGPGSGFRRFILGLYAVGVLAFVIAMVSLISLPKPTLEKMGMN